MVREVASHDNINPGKQMTVDMAEQNLRNVLDEQTNDDGLWFIAETCAEAYLQQELRKLHAVIEEYLGSLQ